MDNTFLWITIALMTAALVSVFAGLGVMIKGGKTNEKYSNTLMRLRVGLQAAALVVFFLYMISR